MSLRRLFVALCATAVGLFLAARAFGPIDLPAVSAAIARADLRLIALAGGCMLLTITARTARAVRILRSAGAAAPPAQIRDVFLASWWLNTTLPARAGDAYRIAALRATSGGGRAMGALVAERAIDMMAVALIAAIAVTVRFGDQVPPAIAIAVIIAAVVATTAAVFILVAGRVRDRLPHPLLRRAASGIAEVTSALRPVAGTTLLLTIVGWGAEVARFAVVATAVGSIDYIGLDGAAATAVVAALLSTVPFSPAGLGVAEAGVAVMATAAGVPGEIAAAAVVLDRLCSTGVVILGGLPFAVRRLARR